MEREVGVLTTSSFPFIVYRSEFSPLVQIPLSYILTLENQIRSQIFTLASYLPSTWHLSVMLIEEFFSGIPTRRTDICMTHAHVPNKFLHLKLEEVLDFLLGMIFNVPL